MKRVREPGLRRSWGRHSRQREQPQALGLGCAHWSRRNEEEEEVVEASAGTQEGVRGSRGRARCEADQALEAFVKTFPPQ